MFSSPLLAVDRTWLPPRLRAWAGRRLSRPPPGPVRQRWRAAIYQLDRLGDFILAVSAIRQLLATWGEADCLLVVSPWAAPLAAREFPRTPRLTLPGNAPSLARNLLPAWTRERPKLRGMFFERVVCLSHHRDLYKEVALSWLASPRLDRLDRKTYPSAPAASWCLELTAHWQLLGTVLGRPIARDEITPRFESITAHPGEELLVCPLASEAVRCLPEPVLIAALERWRCRSRARIALCGPPHETGTLLRLVAVLRQRGLGPVDLAPTPTFDAFVARIAGAGAVFAVESAPAHLATALDKPAVILTGGGTYGLCGPWRRSARQILLQHEVPCYGCGGRCTKPEIYCLTRISPDAIAAALPAL